MFVAGIINDKSEYKWWFRWISYKHFERFFGEILVTSYNLFHIALWKKTTETDLKFHKVIL